MSELILTLEGDTDIVVRRSFNVPPEAVYRAHVDTDLLRRWLVGPEGWSMPVCIAEPWPGGQIRYDWNDGRGGGFRLTGEYMTVEPFHRIVHVERMHLPDPTPDCHIETLFEAEGRGTLMIMRMTSSDSATREAMLATGMEQGMETSYAHLETALSGDSAAR